MNDGACRVKTWILSCFDHDKKPIVEIILRSGEAQVEPIRRRHDAEIIELQQKGITDMR